MPWKTINGNRYYYRRRRVDGRESWEYVGPGILGQLGEAYDNRDAFRAWDAARTRREERRRAEAIEGQLGLCGKLAGSMAAEILTAAGFHRPKRGRWRRKMLATDVQAGPGVSVSPWPGRAEADKILGGGIAAVDAPLLRRVRDLIVEAPTAEDSRYVADLFGGKLWRVACNLLAERHSRSGFVGLAAEAAASGKVGTLARQLAGPDAPLEVRLLADRAALLWARVYLEEIGLDAVARKIGDREAAARERRVERLNRQYMAALRTLAQVKRLFRPAAPTMAVQVNVGEARGGIQ